MSWATGLAYLRAIIWPAVTVGLLLYFHRPVRDVLKALAERMPYLKSVQGPGVGLDYYEAKFIQASAEASSLKAIGAAAEASLASATEEPTTEPPALRDEPGERAATRVNRRVEMSIIDPDPHTDDEPLFREWRAEQMTPKVDLAELAKHSPQTTIVVAWQQLDAIIRMLYRELNPHPPLGDTPGILGQASSVTFELGDAGLLDGGASSVILSALMNLIELRDSVAKRTPSQLEAYQYAYSADQLAGTLRQGVKLMQRKLPTLRRRSSSSLQVRQVVQLPVDVALNH